MDIEREALPQHYVECSREAMLRREQWRWNEVELPEF